MARTHIDTTLITPLTSNLAAGSNKITGLANGTAAGDALAYGQVFPGKIQGFTEIVFTGADATSTTNVYADTGLTSGAFTPVSATSNIFILIVQNIRADNSNISANVQCDVQLLSGASVVRTWSQAALVRDNPAIATNAFYNFCDVFTYLDVSHSGAARTYKTQFSNTNSNGQIRVNNATFGSYLYLVEIGL